MTNENHQDHVLKPMREGALIALLEDDRSQTRLYEKTLEALGHHVVVKASRAEDFLTMCAECPVLDTVIADYILNEGNKDGLEMLCEVLDKFKKKNVFVAGILCTALGSDRDLTEEWKGKYHQGYRILLLPKEQFSPRHMQHYLEVARTIGIAGLEDDRKLEHRKRISKIQGIMHVKHEWGPDKTYQWLVDTHKEELKKRSITFPEFTAERLKALELTKELDQLEP